MPSKYTLRLDEFFKAVEDSPLADRLVEFVIEHSLFEVHMPLLESKRLKSEFCKEDISIDA